MALRHIVKKDDEILAKKCRQVVQFDDRLAELLDDMTDTMRDAQGVGIAAPQVGVLRRLCIIEPEEFQVTEMVNPEIVEAEGEQEGYEGCLSVPGYIGCVTRPKKVKIRFQDRYGKEHTCELEGFAAVAACHELDHLDGILYTEKARDIHRLEPQEDE